MKAFHITKEGAPRTQQRQSDADCFFCTPVVWYTTSSHYRVKQSPKSTTGMSSITYVMLCSARDRSCGQQAIDTSITTTSSTFLTLYSGFFGEKPDSCGIPGSSDMAPFNFWMFPKLKAEGCDTFLTMKI